MIELIFVIVIIGILAAVALPKLVGVQESARTAKSGEFVAQLNSVVMPNLYSKAVVGHNGSIKAYLKDSATPTERKNLSYYIEIPSNFTVDANWVDKIADANVSAGDTVNPIMSDTTNSLYIYCKDGDSTNLPRCWYSAKSSGKGSDLNESKSSF